MGWYTLNTGLHLMHHPGYFKLKDFFALHEDKIFEIDANGNIEVRINERINEASYANCTF